MRPRTVDEHHAAKAADDAQPADVRRAHLACFCRVLDSRTHAGQMTWRREGQAVVGRYAGAAAGALPAVRIRLSAGDPGILFETSADAGAAWTPVVYPHDFAPLAELLELAREWALCDAEAERYATPRPPGPPDPPRPAKPREVG